MPGVRRVAREAERLGSGREIRSAARSGRSRPLQEAGSVVVPVRGQVYRDAGLELAANRGARMPSEAIF